MENNVCLSGRYRVVLKSQDGTVKFDSGVHKNSLTPNLFSHYTGAPLSISGFDGSFYPDAYTANADNASEYSNVHAMEHCFIGTKWHDAADTAWHITDAIPNSEVLSTDTGYECHAGETPEKPDLMWRERVYKFENTANKTVKVRELGLVSEYNESIGLQKSNAKQGKSTLCNRTAFPTVTSGQQSEVPCAGIPALRNTFLNRTIVSSEKLYPVKSSNSNGDTVIIRRSMDGYTTSSIGVVSSNDFV